MTSPVNGARGGRPRIPLDYGEWDQLVFESVPVQAIADALGVSKRTLQRRKVTRARQDSVKPVGVTQPNQGESL